MNLSLFTRVRASRFCFLNERSLRARTAPVFGSISAFLFKIPTREYYFSVLPAARAISIYWRAAPSRAKFSELIECAERRCCWRLMKPGESICQASRRSAQQPCVPERAPHADFIAARRVDTSVSERGMESVTLNDRSFPAQNTWSSLKWGLFTIRIIAGKAHRFCPVPIGRL